MADYARDFVKVPRGVLRELVHDHNTLAVYLVVLDRARYSEGRGLGPGSVVLNAGECVIGRDELAIASGITPAQVRTALDRLQKLEIVAIKTTSRGTVVTLVGYGETSAQSPGESPAESPANRQQATSQSPANRQRVATNREERVRDVDTKRRSLTAPTLAPDGLGPPARGGEDSEAIRTLKAELAAAGGDVEDQLERYDARANRKETLESWLKRSIRYETQANAGGDAEISTPKRKPKKKRATEATATTPRSVPRNLPAITTDAPPHPSLPDDWNAPDGVWCTAGVGGRRVIHEFLGRRFVQSMVGGISPLEMGMDLYPPQSPYGVQPTKEFGSAVFFWPKKTT